MTERLEINSFDDNSVRKIAEAVRRLQAQYRNLLHRLPSDRQGAIGFTIRTGITTTNNKHPSYPAAGCKFVVQFEDWDFVETQLGNCDRDTKAWASKYVVARSYHGKYIEEGTRVIIVKIPGKKGRRWWILPIPPKLRIVRFGLTTNLAFNSTAFGVVLDPNGLSTGEAIIVRDTIGEWHGLATYQGWAVQLDDTPVTIPPTFEILFLEAPARFVQFTLTSHMTGGSATAAVNHAWGLTPNGVTPGATLTVFDRAGLFKRALIGAKGFAVYDEIHTSVAPLGRWVVIQSQSKAGFICFTLTEDRQSQGTATANVVHYWGTQQDVQSPGNSTTVYFCNGHFPHALSGARGIAALDAETDQYRVIECDQMALSCTGEAGDDFCGDDVSISVSSYDEASFFAFGQRPETLNAALNLYGLAAEANSQLWLEFSEVFDDWIAVQAQHVEAELMIDMRYANCKVEKRTQKFWLMTCDAQAGWQTAIQLYSAQFLDSLYKDVTITQSGTGGGSSITKCDIGQRKKSHCVFEQNADLTEEPVITGVGVSVVVRSEDDGECFVNFKQTVFALCVDQNEEEEEVFCTTDCISSGSGQGSGGQGGDQGGGDQGGGGQ